LLIGRELRQRRAPLRLVRHRMEPLADVAHLVERELPKLEVAGSSPVVRFVRALRWGVDCASAAVYADGVVSNWDGTWTYDPVGPVVNGYYKAVVAKKSVRSGARKRSASKPFFVD
jgi:hypothetical protein